MTRTMLSHSPIVKPLAVSLIALLAAASFAYPNSADAQPTANSLKKVVNAQRALGVDNGWVIVDGSAINPILFSYKKDANGDFTATGKVKLRTAVALGAPTMAAGGVVFGPTPAGTGKSRPTDATTFGVGLCFGEVIAGGTASSEGGWVNDVNVVGHETNPNLVPGAIVGVGVGQTNGAYAVGWDTNATGAAQGIVMKLDAAGNTYKPLSQTLLGTLGGPTSQALSISKGATFVVGMADFTDGKPHAVYALTTASSWTDIAPNFPAQVDIGDAGHTLKPILKSQAMIANDAGLIAGTVTVKEDVAGRKNQQVDVGFVFNVNTSTTTFFPFFGANVIPMEISSDGHVVGNLRFVLPAGAPTGSVPSDHPFFYNGTSVSDLGTLTLPSTGVPAYSCRVAAVNGTGEATGSCTATQTDTFDNAANAFFIDAAGGGSFVDLDAAIHTNIGPLNKTIKPFSFTNAMSIDDQEEIVLTGKRNAGAMVAAFIISKNAYK